MYANLLAVITFPVLAQQRDDGSPFFKTYQLTDKVYMLEAPGAGGNIGVFSGPDGVVLIDDRFDQDTAALLEAVAAITPQKIRFLVNTHIHPDHIGGNNNLAAYGVDILAHDSVRLKMLKELRIPRRGGISFPQPPVQARPVITYSEAISFHLNGEEVRVFLAPPAHTDGDSFVHFKGSDVLHLGDVFRTNMYPIIDHFNGGSYLGMIEAMALAIELAGPNTKVIPGHGEGFTDKQGMIEVYDMMTAIRDTVAGLIAQGKTLEEVLAAKPTDAYDEQWGGVASWTSADLLPIVYEELVAQR
ncbi:MAG: MBL fold metallo-hydrolase [SAR86 cluster bacterium]|uniref:MBL fold metallo-hydrolase n=1 Tax=SAR86 cluster bacterium TaxID=2030880 RepID=A0A2A4MLF6_9GAMM|nr:MAG: MBL fold metallo-hydrolase [SAR86 cluster bacterium]